MTDQRKIPPAEDWLPFLLDHSLEQLRDDMDEIFRRVTDDGLTEKEAIAYVWECVEWLVARHGRTIETPAEGERQKVQWEPLSSAVNRKKFRAWVTENIGPKPEGMKEWKTRRGTTIEIARLGRKISEDVRQMHHVNKTYLRETFEALSEDSEERYGEQLTPKQIEGKYYRYMRQKEKEDS